MNYNSILDTFFASGWLCYGLLLLYSILAAIYLFVFFKGKKRQILAIFLLVVIPMFWTATVGMLNPMYFGYGQPFRIAGLKTVNGKLFITDFQRTFGGKSSKGEACYRLHVVDASSGEKKQRFRVGKDGNLVCVKGDTLAFAHYNDVVFYSARNGDILQEWTSESLPVLYPQLATGVADLQMDNLNSQVIITSNDGNKWVLNMYTGKIKSYSGNEPKETNSTRSKLYFDDYEVGTNPKAYGSDLINLSRKMGSVYQYMIYNNSDSLLNSELVFLDGQIVGLSARQNCMVILHYETITKGRFVLTCVSLDGKRKLWEIRQSIIRPDDQTEYPADLSWATENSEDLFYVGINDEVLAIRINDGTIVWRQIP